MVSTSIIALTLSLVGDNEIVKDLIANDSNASDLGE